MERFELDEYNPRPDVVDAIATRLARGAIGALATDTSWSLVTSALDASGAHRLADLRSTPNRGADRRPMSLICCDMAMAGAYAMLDQPQFRLVRRLLPGPYTLILPASRLVPRRLQTKRRAIGIRIPNHAVVQAVIERCEAPLFATTARGANGTLLGSSSEVIDEWQRHLDLIVDATPILPGASTVVDLTGPTPVVLRKGLGPVEEEWEVATDEEAERPEDLRDRRGRLRRSTPR
jgi:tRNA threonylcarbamoyl adenosine modification protein (Sua5/YciO/YrdC/YwlC family)